MDTGKWVPYFEDYKPFHHPQPKTKAEIEMEEYYGEGYYDEGYDPFPFSSDDNEDDYGDESWA